MKSAINNTFLYSLHTDVSSNLRINDKPTSSTVSIVKSSPLLQRTGVKPASHDSIAEVPALISVESTAASNDSMQVIRGALSLSRDTISRQRGVQDVSGIDDENSCVVRNTCTSEDNNSRDYKKDYHQDYMPDYSQDYDKELDISVVRCDKVGINIATITARRLVANRYGCGSGQIANGLIVPGYQENLVCAKKEGDSGVGEGALSSCIVVMK